MAAKRPATLSDLSKKIDDSLRVMKEMRADVNVMRNDVNALQQWKLHEDAFKAALKTVKDEEAKEKFGKLRTDVMKQLLYVLGMVGAVLATYVATRGIH